MDKNKLKAFANAKPDHEGNMPFPKMKGKGGKPFGGKGGKGGEPEDQHDDAGQDEPEDDWDGDHDMLAELTDKLDDIQHSIDSSEEPLDHDHAPSDEMKAHLKEGASKLGGVLLKFVKGQVETFEDAQDLADRISDEVDVEDTDALAGWLYWVSKSDIGGGGVDGKGKQPPKENHEHDEDEEQDEE